MPIVDQDTLTITSVSRKPGDVDLQINFVWTNAAGENLGAFGISFPNFPAMKAFMEEQTMDDVGRNLCGLLVNTTDGSFRRGVFNAMQGKTYRITSKAVEVV